LYYIQAVDIPKHGPQFHEPDLFVQALEVANMASGTNGLISFFVYFHGMRMKITKKILAPEVVQEAPGEVVGIRFHSKESFGVGIAREAPMAPPADHPCWTRGWVLLDYLPQLIEVRLDKSNVDYTGTGRPGVFSLEPTFDDWTLHYKQRIQCAAQAERGKRIISHDVEMVRFQMPGAPEWVGTYQGMQGKTVRQPDGKPIGHTVDLRRPDYHHKDEYKQHLYMILGRATRLEHCLFRNFTQIEEPEDNGNMNTIGVCPKPGLHSISWKHLLN